MFGRLNAGLCEAAGRGTQEVLCVPSPVLCVSPNAVSLRQHHPDLTDKDGLRVVLVAWAVHPAKALHDGVNDKPKRSGLCTSKDAEWSSSNREAGFCDAVVKNKNGFRVSRKVLLKYGPLAAQHLSAVKPVL